MKLFKVEWNSIRDLYTHMMIVYAEDNFDAINVAEKHGANVEALESVEELTGDEVLYQSRFQAKKSKTRNRSLTIRKNNED